MLLTQICLLICSLLGPQATSAKKEAKTPAVASDDAAKQQLALLLEQISRFGVEEGGRASAPAASPEPQAVEPEQGERRDPKEVKKFWDNVRTQLWIDDDELEDPPATMASTFEGRGETSNITNQAAPRAGTALSYGSTSSTGIRKDTKINVSPPDSDFTPESPFGTDPVLKSVKEYYEKKESEEAKRARPTPVAPLNENTEFDERMVPPSLVPAPLRTPGREMASSPFAVTSTSSGGFFDSSGTPTPVGRSRYTPLPSELGSSPPPITAGGEIDYLLTQLSRGGNQSPHSPTGEMGSSPPIMAASVYRSDGSESAYSQEGDQYGSSPPLSDTLGSGHRAQIHHPTIAALTGADERAPPNNPLSLDRYRHLTGEQQEDDVSSSSHMQLPRLPRSSEATGSTTSAAQQERSGTKEGGLGNRRRPPFRRINTSLANMANPRAHQFEAYNPFTLPEEDEEDLDTPILPRLPRSQGGGGATTTDSADADRRAAENRVTRWPMVAPLRLRSSSGSGGGSPSPSNQAGLSSSAVGPSTRPGLAPVRAATLDTAGGSGSASRATRAATVETGSGSTGGSGTGSSRSRRHGVQFLPGHRRNKAITTPPTTETTAAVTPTLPGPQRAPMTMAMPMATPPSAGAPTGIIPGGSRTDGGMRPSPGPSPGTGTGSVSSSPFDFGPPPFPPPSYPPPRRPQGQSQSQSKGQSQSQPQGQGQGQGHGHGRGRGQSSASSASSAAPKTPIEKIIELDEFFANI